MDNASLILQTLDGYLNHPARLSEDDNFWDAQQAANAQLRPRAGCGCFARPPSI